MTIRRVNLTDVAPEPWRNGGGSTRELLAWPQSNDWLLRVSVAEIAQDGPFSSFPGIDRHFAVLSGNGVKLTLPTATTTLSAGDPPIRFAGEEAPDCELVNGATQDLNLMINSEAAAGKMWLAEKDHVVESNDQWLGLFAAERLTVDCNGNSLELAAGSFIWDVDDPKKWQVISHGLAFWMQVEVR